MDCQRCGSRPASVHISQIVNGVKSETHLCEECAKQSKVNLEFSHHSMENINNLLGFFTQGYSFDKGANEAVCSNCGTSYRRTAELGYVGCSNCYDQFTRQLESVLRKIHGTNQHRGKIPARRGSTFKVKKEIENLKISLNKAVQREEYEDAAALRDEIRKLEGKLGES